MKKAEYVKALLALADANDSLFINEYLNKEGKLSAKKIANEYNVKKKIVKFYLQIREQLCQLKHI